MLKLMSIVRPQKAEVLCQQLLASGKALYLRAVQIQGRGRRGLRQQKQGPLEYLPKVAVTLYCEPTDKEDIIDIIQSACRSGRRGDGKIFISEVQNFFEF